MISDFAIDSEFLRKTRTQNVIEMCQRHDWRYRIREIHRRFELKIPPPLVEELALLELITTKMKMGVTG